MTCSNELTFVSGKQMPKKESSSVLKKGRFVTYIQYVICYITLQESREGDRVVVTQDREQELNAGQFGPKQAPEGFNHQAI